MIKKIRELEDTLEMLLNERQRDRFYDELIEYLMSYYDEKTNADGEVIGWNLMPKGYETGLYDPWMKTIDFCYAKNFDYSTVITFIKGFRGYSLRNEVELLTVHKRDYDRC